MFTIIIQEVPQANVALPLALEEDAPLVKPIERLRVTVPNITERQMKTISKLAWKFPRKTRKDKGIRKPKKPKPELTPPLI